MSRTYTIRIQSPFLLTQSICKSKLGTGFKVIEVNIEKDIDIDIQDIDSAVQAILKTGYRSLARANHPDLGGNQETMAILNRAKKELQDLLYSVGIEKEAENGNRKD